MRRTRQNVENGLGILRGRLLSVPVRPQVLTTKRRTPPRWRFDLVNPRKGTNAYSCRSVGTCGTAKDPNQCSTRDLDYLAELLLPAARPERVYSEILGRCQAASGSERIPGGFVGAQIPAARWSTDGSTSTSTSTETLPVDCLLQCNRLVSTASPASAPTFTSSMWQYVAKNPGQE